jgi:hypothetical protein
MLIRLLGAVLFTAAVTIPAGFASDRTGVYARVDKVVFEPNAESPERAQVWGVFAIAQTDNPNDYQSPARGYLYFKLDSNSQATRNEWNDLKQVAGTGEIVAFGSRRTAPRLRKPDQKPEEPDAYGVNVGVVKIRNRTDYPPVRSLREFKD